MNFGFRSKAKAFFVDVDSPSYHLDESVNVILSPSMYWVKRVTLPVKYLREVKSLIPSLFEENLPDGKYSYSAYKDGDSFLIFAYNDKEVLDLLNRMRELYVFDVRKRVLKTAVFVDEFQRRLGSYSLDPVGVIICSNKYS